MKSLLVQRLRVFVICCFAMAATVAHVAAQEVDPEEAKEKSIADRFVVVLEKNPRRGTALDKVYGFHVERGSLEALIEGYRQKTRTLKGTDAGSAWMIVGLLESLRGQDAVAATAFEQAEKLANDNYLAPFYLGHSLVLVGQPDKAAEAFERSIQRKPAVTDLLDVYQALGRVYQRAQKTDKALDVWNRLEQQFPHDARVQEQIATTLLEENEFAAALPRYESLAKNTKDKYRQSLFQMESAEIKVRLGKSNEAIKEFESLLGQLLPENWLYREVRRRIEGVYLRTDDQAGLVAYYENWLKTSPNDLEAVSRLSRLLAGLGRGPEAQKWLENGLKSAPKNKELRHALIGQLVYEQKFTEAIAQYEQLDKHEPNNPDTLRDWGRLLLKDTSKDETARKQAASAIWRRLTDAKPKDALVASQVGELFRQAEMTDEALKLYQKAISLAPDQAQYREYLGEYFHALKRKEEALATWRGIAEDKSKTAPNLARLAEVLASFGYVTEAVKANTEACRLDPKDFALQLKQVDLLAQADQHDASLAQLTIVKKLAANDEEREAWMIRDLRELQALDRLKDRISELAQDADTRNPDRWFWLARAYEAERQLTEASQAITKAGELAPQSIPILMASARIYESQNNLLAAVEINTRLAAIDRRYRTEYLKQVATLEQKLGRRTKAIQAGRDLIAAAPGNPELYEFFSQLCFQLGETEEGLGALRRSVRVNPTEPKGLLLLASALGEQFRTSEAIELYWRAFEKAPSLDDRLAVVPRLTELYLQTNQLDRLLERLERQRREPNQQREMTICIAQVFQSAGDDGNARQELEKLLTEDTRDVQLLTQLVKLCETDGDLEAAIRFQQQLLKSAPGKDGTMRLAQLLMKSGEVDEASALMSRITIEEKDPETVLKSIDSMLVQRNYEQALQIAEKLTRDQPKNWELIYREGLALAKSKDKLAEAKSRFEMILAMNLDDDDQSLSVKNQLKKTQGRTRLSAPQAREMNSMLQRSQMVWQIRQAVGMDNQNYYGNQQQPLWMPQDFGTARITCMAWLTMIARRDGKEDEFVQEHRDAAEKTDVRRVMIDWYYLSALNNNAKDTYTILKRLSMRPDADVAIKSMYLTSLTGRGIGTGTQDDPIATAPVDEAATEGEQPGPRLSPLDKTELEHVLNCFKSTDTDLAMMNYGQSFVQIVAAELKRSGRKDESEQMLKDAIDRAHDPGQIALLLGPVVQQNDYDTAIKLLDRLAEIKTDSAAGQTVQTGVNYAQYLTSPEYQSQILAQLMANRAQKKALGDVLGLWDRFLVTAVARREKQTSLSAVAKRRNAMQQGQFQQQGYVLIWKGGNQRYENLDFPLPNEVYDQSMIQMLRQAYAIYNDAELAKDLVDHFQSSLASPKTPEAQKIFWQFGLGYLHWWMDNKDEALGVLAAATDAMPDGQEMKFELARLHERRGEHDLALQLIDSLPTTDQQSMQKREITALRMAVNSGNIDRARLAAERLFGLRLDSNLQIQLARQMHQLGMHEQAEAVLARAGRQAGNKTDVLSNLMQQYQSQGKNEIATQIAHQLLRRSAGGSAAMAMGRVRSSPQGDQSGTRQQALDVLKRSGKLPDMIAKVEAQLKNAPKSQRLVETLLEYYTANNDQKKVDELSARIAETKQDDPQFRYNLGLQLMNQGKFKEAADHFKLALKKEPRLMINNSWQIVNAFQNADKLDDLSSLFNEIDLKVFGQNPWELSNVIGNLANREKSKDSAVQIFKRAWKQLPDQRQQLLQSANNDIFWQMPEIYDYARQGLIPTQTSVLQNNGWSGFGQIQSYGGDGKITTLMTRFLAIATSGKKLDELTKEIEDAQKKVKKWDGGTALLALIDLHRGKADEAKTVLEKLLPNLKNQQQGQYTRWEIGQELMSDEKCIDLAIQYLESACTDPDVMSMNGFQLSPGKPLVALYKKRGRLDEARRVMLEASRAKSNRMNGNNGDWEAYYRVQNAHGLGSEMLAMGFAVDALRLYQQQLARTEDFEAVRRIYGGGGANNYGDQLKKQIETGFESALGQLKPELLPELLAGPGIGGAATTAQESTNPPRQSVDMMLLIESRELNRTKLSSALGKMLAGLASKPELIEKTRTVLAEICSKSPDDLTAMILAAQLAQSTNQSTQAAAAVRQLVDFIEKNPLEAKPIKGTFTARQREEALRQTAVWLVARDCLKQESLRAQGEKLGERALEAARRQTDNGYLLAILREWGQVALEMGDKGSAERRWTEMLQIIIPKPAEKKNANDPQTGSRANARRKIVRATFTPRNEVDSMPVMRGNSNGPLNRSMSRWELLLFPAVIGQVPLAAPAAVAPAPAAPAGARGNVVTLAQFEQAAQIAKLAAENGLNDLSMKAMTLAFQAGPPIEAMQAIDPNQPFAVNRNNQDPDQLQLARKVEERLASLEQLWRKKGIADDAIFELLKSAVLPESRPFEVFLYPRPLNRNPNQQPQSIGSLLVKAAIKAGKVDDVKRLIEPRLKQPLGELSGRVLLAQLAMATRDSALAAEQIELLSKRLQQDSLQSSSELACHAAIPALSLSDIPPTALVLFERAVGHFSQNAAQTRGNAQEEPMRSFRFALARIQFERNNPEAGKKHLEDYLNLLTPMYARYGGDYGQYRKRIEMMKVAAEYARAGQRMDALDCLGRYADLPTTRNYGQESSGRATVTILAGLQSVPAAERYQLLKTWTLPTADRKSVRIVGGLVPGDSAPAAFDSLRGAAPRGPKGPQLMSTAELLVAAAAESKKLDELCSELTPYAAQNVEHAEFLLLLTRIARGDGAAALPALSKYLDDRKAAMANPNNANNRASLQITDIILAHQAIADKALKSTGRELAVQFVSHASRFQDHVLMAIGRRENFTPAVGAEVAHRLNFEPWNTGLKHWTAGAVVAARTEAAGAIPMWWIVHEGLLAHLCGPDDSHLYFKYPLTGEFNVTCNSWLSGWGENDLGYGGLVYNGLNLGSDTQIVSVGNRRDSVHKPDPPEVLDRYNAVSLEMRQDKVRYKVNQTLIHEEPRSSTVSPWLFVHCNRVWHTVIQDLKITGKPVIPREVSLVDKDSLLGWVTEFYGETQPNRESNRKAVADADSQNSLEEFDWQAVDGVIHGRILPYSGLGKNNVQQSRLHYDRPLLDAEKIQYEFWYEAGPMGCHVAPALDRLAFLLDTDGVSLHWMTDGSTPEDGYTGLGPDNLLVDKSIQRGKVRLKDRDWNSVQISLKNEAVTLMLNGDVVAVRKLEPENNRQFGFYHDQNASTVQVRNVVLSGDDWPQTLSPEIASNLFATTRQLSPVERRGFGATIDEKFHAEGMDKLLLRTRSLRPDQQYEALKTWVLPNDDHVAFRVYGAFTPHILSPSVDQLDPARIDADPSMFKPRVRRQFVGGQLYSPVFDLVAVAKTQNRLKDLANDVERVAPNGPVSTRSKLAMKILIEIAGGDLQHAAENLNQLHSLCQAISDDVPMLDRWAELIVGAEATEHPELRTATLPLLSTLVEQQRKKNNGESWEVRVCGLRDRCKTLINTEQTDLAGDTSPKGQWIPAITEWANANGRGPVAQWTFGNQQISQSAGDGHNYLYFQSPLRGTFTVEAEVSTYGWRETRMAYHGHWVGPQYTRVTVDLGNLTSSWQGPKIEPALEFGDWCQMKLEVQPGKATFYISDRQVHELTLPDQADPWLALMKWGNHTDGARWIRITGQPEIPRELNISARKDLTGWTATLYLDPMGNDENAAWLKSDAEIVGKKFEAIAGRKRQSLLRYHRPLQEDSVVSYDFFYVPNQTHVHPALGRLSFLLDPDGVKLHWLTDAQWDRSGIGPDNAVVDKSCQSGPALLPLKQNDWNHLEMTVVGDSIKLKLNSVDVYEAPVPLTNQRQFGLFHYADETDVRVKNVVYRGDWPTTLPTLKAQEFSGMGPKEYDFGDGELSPRLAWDFQGPKPSFLKLWGAVKPNRMEPVEGGLKIVRPEKAGQDATNCGFEWRADVPGDFEATLAYRNFESQTEQPDWQIPRIEMFLHLGGEMNSADNTHSLFAGHRRLANKGLSVYSGHGTHVENTYDWKYASSDTSAAGGRLRIVRKGTTAFILHAKPDSDVWLLLAKGPVSAAPLKAGSFGLRVEMPTSLAEVVFTDFVLRAKESAK